MKKLSILLISLILIITTNICCSQNYLPVSLVTKAQDSITGFVLEPDWNVNPQKISFRKTLEGDDIIYSTSNLKSFTVLNITYVSAYVNHLTRGRDINLESKNNIKYQEDSVFLEVLVQGPKSLYALTNQSGYHNYYVKNQDEYKLLIYEKYFEKDGAKTLKKENKNYIGLLKYYLQDCPKVKGKFDRLIYDRISFISLFNKYYSCFEGNETSGIVKNKQSVRVKRKKKNTNFKSSVFVGMGISEIELYNAGVEYLREADVTSSNPIMLGYGFKLSAPNVIKWISFKNEIMFSSSAHTGKYSIEESVDKLIEYEWEVSYGGIKTNHMLNFDYHISDKFFVYVDGGISFSSRKFSNNNLTRTITYSDDFGSLVRVYETSLLSETKNLVYNPVFGAGVGYWKFSLAYRYDFPTKLSAAYSTRAKEQVIYFILKYTF